MLHPLAQELAVACSDEQDLGHTRSRPGRCFSVSKLDHLHIRTQQEIESSVTRSIPDNVSRKFRRPRCHGGILWEHPSKLFFQLKIEIQRIGLGMQPFVALNTHTLQSGNVEELYCLESEQPSY